MIYERISPVGAFQQIPITSALLMNKSGDKFFLWQLEADSTYTVTPVTSIDDTGQERVVAFTLECTLYYMLNKYVLGLSADGSKLIDALDAFNGKGIKLILNCGNVLFGDYATDLQGDFLSDHDMDVMGNITGEHYVVTDYNCSCNTTIESVELRSRTKVTLKCTFRKLKDITNLDGLSDISDASKKTIIQSFLNATTVEGA